MTLDLIRRDPALRALPKWLFIGAATCSVLMGVLGVVTFKFGTSAMQNETLRLVSLSILAWGPVAGGLFFGKTRIRCSEFDLPLPVPAKRLWLTHVVAMVLMGLLLGAAALGVIAGHAGLLRRVASDRVPDLGTGSLAPALIAGVAVAVVLLQSRQIGLRTLRRNGRELLFTIGTLVGVYLLIVLLSSIAAVWSLVPVVVAVALGARSYRSVPPAFAVVPFEPEEPGSGDAGSAEAGRWATALREGGPPGRSTRWATVATIIQIMSRGVLPGAAIKVSLLPTLGIPILVGWGLFQSGVFFAHSFSELDVSVLTAYLLFAFVGGPLAQLHLLDPLPISRKTLFALVSLPLIAVLAIGYGAGKIWSALHAEPRALVAFQTEIVEELFPSYAFEQPMVRVPIEYCLTAPDGDVPENVSPWGESYEAFNVGVRRGSPARLYTPFGTPKGSSIEFVALQISRAIAAVYGVAVAPEELQERYLEIDPDGVVVPKEAGLTLLEDYPGLRAPRRTSLSPVVWTVIGGFFFVAMGVYLRFVRMTIRDGARKFSFFAVLIGLLVLHVSVFVFDVLFTKPYITAMLVRVRLSRLSDFVPGGAVIPWAACLLLIAAAFWFAQSQFLRIEVPLPTNTSRE